MLKRDRGRHMQQDQQISRRSKYIEQAQEQIECLKQQMAAIQKEISVNSAHITRHIKQVRSCVCMYPCFHYESVDHLEKE